MNKMNDHIYGDYHKPENEESKADVNCSEHYRI